MKSPQVGLVGCGGWGQNILRDLKLLGASVHVVARSAASRARAAAHRADSIVGDVPDLPRVDAVYIATPTHTHAEVIESVIDRAVPVFCEKPLTDHAARAEALTGRAQDRLFVLDKWRYHPGVRAIADTARSRELGEVVGLSTRRLGWGNAHPESNALWVLGPHDLSIGLEILGAVLPVQSAVADGIPAGAGNPPRISGFTALLSDGQVWQCVELSERSPERVRLVRLYCSEGIATLPDPFADHIAIHRLAVGEPDRPNEVERRPISDAWPLKVMLAETLEFLQGGPPPKTAARDGATMVRRLEEIRSMAGLS